MSLFKAREWWSTTVGDGEEFDLGCLCAANLDGSGIDKIVVGSFHGYLRVYQPNPVKSDSGGWSGFKPSDVVCESHIGLPVIQVDAGRFVSGSQSTHLAVLHPRKLAVYSLICATGRAEHGNQNELKLAYEHKLQRTAFNFCYGNFGGVQGRDFICVQSMDGTVSIFEQEGFAFSRFLPSALLPGPIKYLPRSDSFVTVSSSRQVETYKYQVLATATDAKTKEESQSLRSGKKVASDWTFNLGEQAIDIAVYSGNAGSTIHVLGERSLFVLTEGGKLKLMKKFDFNPSCFLPYASVSGDTINTLVATHTDTLMVLQDVTLKWAAQVPHVPVEIKVANLQDLKGVIVMLTEEGHLSCRYLGTDPSMFTPPTAEVRELDYTQLDQEMKGLQRQIKEHQSKNTINLPTSKQEDDLEISVQVPLDLDQQNTAEDIEFQDEDPVPAITVKVVLKAKTHLNDIKLSVNVAKPLVASDTSITYPSLEPNRPGETSVTFYQKYEMLPYDLKADITVSYLSPSGAPRVVSTIVKLPLKLVCKPFTPVKNALYKITIDTNKPPINLNDIFPDLLGDSAGGPGNALGFKYYSTEPVVTVLASKTSQRYRLQSDQFEEIWLVLDEFVKRMIGHHSRSGSKDFKITYDGALPLQEYFDVLDKHFECRVHDVNFKKMLEERASQFRAIQRRLLTRFKDKTPAPLNNLDTLLDGTYRQLLAVAEHTDENLQFEAKCSANLSAGTRMLLLLIKFWQNLNDAEYSVLEHALSPVVSDNAQNGWEEMVDAAITHLLRTCLSKSSKDQAVNPSPLAMLKDTQKLKKHIALVCDRLSKGAKLHIDGYEPVLANSYKTPLHDALSRPSKPSTQQSKKASSSVPNLDSLAQTYGTESTGTSSYGTQQVASTVSRPPMEPKQSLADLGLPSLSTGDTDTNVLPELSARLPPLSHTGESSKFIKKKSAEELVPDLDNMEDEPIVNGTKELVYGMEELGL